MLICNRRRKKGKGKFDNCPSKNAHLITDVVANANFDFSQIGVISPHPFIYAYSFRFYTYNFDNIIFALYVNYAAFYISFLRPF